MCSRASSRSRPSAAGPCRKFVINRAEAAIVTRVAIARGFAANDPRIAATMTAMGESSTALNVVSTGAASLGILAAGSALVAGSLTLSRSQDGHVITAMQPLPVPVGADYPLGSVPQPGQPVASAMQDVIGHGVMNQRALIYHTSLCQASDSYCSAFPAVPTGQKNFSRDYGSIVVLLRTLSDVQAYDAYEQQFNSASGTVGRSGYDNGGSDSLNVTVAFQPNVDNTTQTLVETRTIKLWTPSGPQIQQSSQPAYWWTVGPGVAPVTGTDLSQIYGNLTDASKAQPLDPMTLAQVVNQTWQSAAAQPGYQGLPFPASQPVTTADVQPWVVANPSLAPNISDLFRPASDPGTQTVPISPTVQPATSVGTDPASGTSPASSPGIDPGTGTTGSVCGVNGVVCTMNVNVLGDPGTASPTLESTPTIAMILDPIINLLPDFKSWAVPPHGATCPTPTFDLFGKSITMTSQCDLAEQHRGEIYGAFLAAFSLAALFIVLGA
jgi:hypothetical protein